MDSRIRLGAVLGVLILGLAAIGGCGTASTATVPERPIFATDANGTPIKIPAAAPQRIISLGATDSEILGALKVDSRVVGVDAFTDYPADLAAKLKVTDANGQPNIEQIIALKPDLVLSFGGEVKQADLQLEQVHVAVVDLPAVGFTQSITEISLVGQLVHAEATAQALVRGLDQRIATVEAKVKGQPPVKVYMEVDDSSPGKLYIFGQGTFGDGVIQAAGGTNVFGTVTAGAGYGPVSSENVIVANPQVVILTEDPRYGGDPSQVPLRTGWSAIDAVKHGRIYQLNTDLFQRPGPRVIDGLEQLAKLLSPGQFV
jgi:iron complex transport system substrate-binding protein